MFRHVPWGYSVRLRIPLKMSAIKTLLRARNAPRRCSDQPVISDASLASQAVIVSRISSMY